MKFNYLLLCVAIAAASCGSNNSKTAEATPIPKSDTTFMTGPEIPAQDSQAVVKEEPEPERKTPVTVKKKPSKSASTNSENSAGSTTTENNTSNTGAQNEGTAQTTAEPEKKGWSKTAKGAVIGGVVGAGTGAIVNKKNRVAGAVIGGVIGAGAGAVIGNEMDKKDDRH